VTANAPHGLVPVASFVIEREAGEGYRVTASDGDQAEERKRQALELLNNLGQPDPRGPDKFFRWLGPVTPGGEYIGVSVKLLSNGDVSYHQGWFRLPVQPHHSRPFIWLLPLMLALGIAAGIIADQTIFAPAHSAPSSITVSQPPNGPAPSAAEHSSVASQKSPADAELAKLKVLLKSSQDVRTKLSVYLSQDGLGAVGGVTAGKRSIKIIADLDRWLPKKFTETVMFNDTEVDTFLSLLRYLDDLLKDAARPRTKAEE
jgi:hypothetical protein